MLQKSKEIFPQVLLKLERYIADNGLRQTPERVIVLRRICELKIKPFTVQDVADAVAEDFISLPTVYNALSLLLSARILHSLNRQLGARRTQYELVAPRAKRAQMICVRCGRVVAFDDKAVDTIVKERKYSNFVPKHYSLYVYGECKVCRKRQAKEKILKERKSNEGCN